MKILVLPGDGTGPEITEATLAVLDCANAKFKLGLFANIRPAKSRMGVGLTGKPVDLVIFRECTEGFYADRNMFGDILSAAMLLEWLAARHRRPEFEQAAKAIEAAIDASLQDAATRTADLGGKLGTRAFTKQVVGLLG